MRRLLDFFSHKENWPIVLIPLLLLLWGQYGAPALALKSFDSLTLYEGIYRDPVQPGEADNPLVENVLLIIVDGLGVETSKRMSSLEQIRANGADRVAQAGEPSYSLPSWTAITTGAWHEQSGFATNFVERSVEIDSVFAAASRAGLTTAISGPGPAGYDQLYGGQVDMLAGFDQPEDAYTNTEAMAQVDADIAAAALDQSANFQLVHFTAVDNAGHGYGGTSPEYEAAAQNVDGHIAQLLASTDLETTAMLVTSDHGHIAAGGHAGPEPEVIQVPLLAMGAGIKPGKYDTVDHVDITPTIAVLLGTSFPAHIQGRALLDMISGPPELEAARAVDNAEQVSTRIESMLAAIGATIEFDKTSLEDAREEFEAGDYDEAVTLASEMMSTAEEVWMQAREARLNRERLPRLAIAIVLLVPAVLYLIWWRNRGWEWRLPWLGAIVYLVLWNLNYFIIRDLRYSLSMFNVEEDILSFIEGRVIESLVIMVIIILLIGILRRERSYTDVARVTVHAFFAIALVLMVQILFFFVLWDVEFDWYLPNASFGFKYYMDVFQSTVFWPLLPLPFAALAPLLAIAIAWVVGIPNRRKSWTT
jgi:hypothetical protein